MRSFLPRPSAPLVVASLALLVAGTGTGYAAGLARNSVGTPQLKANAVTSAKIKANTVTGADVKESTLRRVPEAADAQRVGGTPLAGLLQTTGCQPGKTSGSARIAADGGTLIATSFGTAGVSEAQNCSGGAVEARRIGVGRHVVRFVDNPAAVAFAQVLFDSDGTDEAVCATVRRAPGTTDVGGFAVTTFNCTTLDVRDADFALLLP